MRHLKIAGRIFVIFATAIGLTGQEAAPQGGTPASSQARKSTVIGPADTISINALNCEDVSKTWRVSNSGELNLPLVGRMQVSGLTVEQLEQQLTVKLGKFLKEPQVSVFVTEFRSQPVIVTGAVQKAGTLQLEGSKTLFEVLLMAGGPKDAGPTVTIKRGTEHGKLALPGTKMDRDGTYTFADVDLTEVMTGRGDLSNIPVEPYDLITVSAVKAARYVHISGEVMRPGSVELVSQDSVSLMKVLAVAGGMTPNATAGRTLIMHINGDGLQTSTSIVDLNKITSGKAKDLELTTGDVVVVPTSGIKSALRLATASAITSGVYTGVYVIGKF